MRHFPQRQRHPGLRPPSLGDPSEAGRSNRQPSLRGETKTSGFSARTGSIAVCALCPAVMRTNRRGSREALSVPRTRKSASSTLAPLQLHVDLDRPGPELLAVEVGGLAPSRVVSLSRGRGEVRLGL